MGKLLTAEEAIELCKKDLEGKNLSTTGAIDKPIDKNNRLGSSEIGWGIGHDDSFYYWRGAFGAICNLDLHRITKDRFISANESSRCGDGYTLYNINYR